MPTTLPSSLETALENTDQSPMTWKHIHREEAPNVGDPDDASIGELTGEAPPCDDCGTEQAIGTYEGRDLCADCHPEQ